MAQLVSVKLSRFDSAPWGFRLQGGKDFAQPLVIQKVNGNSLAEKAGLQAGDALIRVNNVDLFNLTHKDAQNALVHAGNSFELTIQRGGSTWKPSVTPVGPAPIQATANLQPVTKTSLAYKQPPASAIGSQHNTAAKPFSPSTQVNGETAKSLASKAYNSPIGLYSEETIAETLSAQTEVLAGGVLGVNFMKNEKTYNAANSEVLKMVQEIDNEPREPEPVGVAPTSAPTTPKAVPATNPIAGLRHVAPPESKPEQSQDPLKVLPPGQNICADCERLIVHAIGGRAVTPCPTTPSLPPPPPQQQTPESSVAPDAPAVSDTPKCSDCQRFIVGLFVRIKDKNLHVECFKCATCGTSLKNVGYYNINSKLYCDVHAKLVARQNPPAPNLEPVTIPPGVKPPPSSVIGSALSSAAYQPAPAPAPLQPFQSSLPSVPSQPSPGSPLLGTLAPLPFHAPQSGIRHVNAPRSIPFTQTPASSAAAPCVQAPKLNFSPSTVSSATRPLSEIQADAGIQYQSYSMVSQSSYDSFATNENVNFTGLLSENTNCSSELSERQSHKKLSLCSQELETLHTGTENVVKPLSEILEEQDRCPSPTPIDEIKTRVTQDNEISKEEKMQIIEQQQQWKNYQSGPTLKSSLQTGLGFLRSHSTPVTELEELYEKQQKEIEEQKEFIRKLGYQKRISIDETQIRHLENQIMESEIELAQKQKKQEEIVKKKSVHFEKEEELRKADEARELGKKERDRHQQQEKMQELKEESTKLVQQYRKLQENQKREHEFEISNEIQQKKDGQSLRNEEDRSHNVPVPGHRERARTPVADLEAYERHDGMSEKTETIYHAYEHLVQEEEEDEFKKVKERLPATPSRALSPFPGSIPGAEKNLLLKNIQGIEIEWELSNPKKAEPNLFKLPDLRNLKANKTDNPSTLLDIKDLKPTPSTNAPPSQKSIETFLSRQDLDQHEKLQQQQIKEQRKQVHEEMALNERFRKKQERLATEPPKFERAKTPVAELEEEERHRESSESTHHVYESYDQVLAAADRPRSRIGQPVPKNQSITEAEKSLFFQNISGINYEFENIAELTATKYLPEEQKSLFIRNVEERTKSPITIGFNDYSKKTGPVWTPKLNPYQSQFVQALTTMPDSSAAAKSTYEQFRSEQEILYQKQKQEQKYLEKQILKKKQGLGENKPIVSPFVAALTIAPDRPFSPLPSVPLVTSVQSNMTTSEAHCRLNGHASPTDLAKSIEKRQSFAATPAESVVSAPNKHQLDDFRRRSSGFPGANVQRTPYQMLRGSQIQSAFMEDLLTQKSSISQFMSDHEESSTDVRRKDTIDCAFGLLPSTPQFVYAPLPDKRVELIANQTQFESCVNVQANSARTEERNTSKPISLTEALTIAPETSYMPFPETPKPQATLINGGASVALTKNDNLQKSTNVPPFPSPIQLKPNYEVRDVQLSKNIIKGEYTGIKENKKSTSIQEGAIDDHEITGTYRKKQEQLSNNIQLEKSLFPLSTTDPSIGEPNDFLPVSDQLKAEISQLKQTGSTQKSALQSEQVETFGEVTKTTKRRVVEVAESTHKEFSQIRVIGGIDPISGLRRTSNEEVSKSSASITSQPSSAAGLQKPTSIPSYQNLVSEPQIDRVPVVLGLRVDSKDLKPRPKSAIGERVALAETKVPLTFRSRTPVPLPKIDFSYKAQLEPLEISRRNGTPYNQDYVSPKHIQAPKVQSSINSGPTSHQTSLKTTSTVFRTTSPLPVPPMVGYRPTQHKIPTLKPTAPAVYRSTSPVFVPRMVKTNETYQQPMPSWRIQPVKNEKRMSWPPKEELMTQPTEILIVVPQNNVKAKIIQQEEQAKMDREEEKRSFFPRSSTDKQNNKSFVSQNSSQTILNQAEHCSHINTKEVMSSVIEISDQGKINCDPIMPKTSLINKGQTNVLYPKHDPITAPRPFGTPTPQRKLATPHFQPITPVAITECPNTAITTPKLTFSSSQATDTSTAERKTSLSLYSNTASAFKPLDTIVPIKPVATRPIPAQAPAPIPSSARPASADNGAGAGAGGPRGASFGGVTAPRRGRGVLNPPNAARIPLCAHCNGQVRYNPWLRGPFITALGKIWCPDHFVCTTSQCRRPLADIGFVEEQGKLHCEFCFEKYIAPNCDKCSSKVKGDCLLAVGKHFHPECFTCAYCGKLFGNSAFFLEDGLPYCENDWNELFTTKCFACGFPIEPGDRWVEALNNNYHSQCFNCAVCKKNLEGQSFFAKGGRPFCKAHAR